MSLLLSGELDALFFVGGYPAVGISDLADRGVIELVPLVGPEAAAIHKRDRFFSRDTIPADTYEGVGEVKTLSVNAQLVVSADSDEELIYQVTKALWHPTNRTVLETGHAKGRLIRPETALDGVSVPLHPGAERYYREAGLIE
jgi:TRAP transporter TAXI family solute receptor